MIFTWHRTTLLYLRKWFRMISGRREKSRLKRKSLSLRMTNDSWRWNGKQMCNIGHRSLFNYLLSNILIDDTRNLVIFLDERCFSDYHFWTLVALKTTLFQQNSSRHTSHFKVRNLRRFLKILFLHLAFAIRTRWGIIVQLSDDLLVCVLIDDV